MTSSGQKQVKLTNSVTALDLSNSKLMCIIDEFAIGENESFLTGTSQKADNFKLNGSKRWQCKGITIEKLIIHKLHIEKYRWLNLLSNLSLVRCNKVGDPNKFEVLLDQMR